MRETIAENTPVIDAQTEKRINEVFAELNLSRQTQENAAQTEDAPDTIVM